MSNKSKTILSITDACLGYNSKIVLSGLSINLSLGEKLLITGQNGSGKTTLLKSILKIIPIIKGSLLLNGKCSYCKQDYHDIKFPISAKEIIEIGFYKQKLSKFQKNAKLDYVFSVTDTFYLKDRLFNTLSGGERQRVNIARCLCQDFDLLLLDEPTSYIDDFSRKNLISILKSDFLADKSIILISHDNFIKEELCWNELNIDRFRNKDE